MAHLRELDEVAYVRFASVYRSFRDIDEFLAELGKLVKSKDRRERACDAVRRTAWRRSMPTTRGDLGSPRIRTTPTVVD